MLVIKISGALAFVGAVLVAVGIEIGRDVLSYVALGLAGVALLAVLISALPLRRRPTHYP